ncbi:hypothetical protein Mp_4g16310 [Marchantia polymorpha subsp. ruderalis]|uniref:Uncharacterized protein n=2 Tax=Marchantia polymorpha TaxID=3197 RepID=A0AAF6BAG7_MARPO|nr:hypothetical protein MARPO_0054s0097 [Marchantia polymorpha]BBN09001.1 hypothetical protein Mp_4g16310 [Marchantia polymorpha subsp. ruderalis]|eukprot:PTQ37990.1 hypothetical protein MARPO_0054s0097 [Marchantia polymorpha]
MGGALIRPIQRSARTRAPSAPPPSRAATGDCSLWSCAAAAVPSTIARVRVSDSRTFRGEVVHGDMLNRCCSQLGLRVMKSTLLDRRAKFCKLKTSRPVMMPSMSVVADCRADVVCE